MLITSLLAEDFLLQEEYIQMFYLNPRGISCAKCHGLQGQGLTLTQYNKKGKTIFIEAPNIQNANFMKLKRALKNDKKSLMPSYNLTNDEIKALEQYLAKVAKGQ